MITTKNKFSCVGFSVVLTFDDFINSYNVTVRYEQSGGKFFSRDYKTKGSAMRSYNSWVTKLSVVDTRFANVK